LLVSLNLFHLDIDDLLEGSAEGGSNASSAVGSPVSILRRGCEGLPTSKG